VLCWFRGVRSSRGKFVFAGHGSECDAFDADTGARLWRSLLGGVKHAAPISFANDNQQFIAILAARLPFVFDLPPPAASNAAAAVPRAAARTATGRK
jgi:hypothetical protein